MLEVEDARPCGGRGGRAKDGDGFPGREEVDAGWHFGIMLFVSVWRPMPLEDRTKGSVMRISRSNSGLGHGTNDFPPQLSHHAKIV